MGLIRAAVSAAGSVLADQWKEYFYCDALSTEVLAARASKRSRGGNRGSDNVISNGSVISVADGQCMMIVEQGKIVDVIHLRHLLRALGVYRGPLAER